jgi:hypothetical protein
MNVTSESTDLQCAANWTLREEDQNYFERYEMWRWKRMKKISWTDRVRNEVYVETRKKGTLESFTKILFFSSST